MREYRNRIRAVRSTQKITKAFELIAASRMIKAQQRTRASTPYANAITRAVSAVATYSNEDHPLTREKANVDRAAMLLVTADRGLAGAYSSNVLRAGERLAEKLRGEGKTVVPYIAGRKGVSYYRFRRRDIVEQWVGFSDAPQFENAKEIADTLIEAFLAGSDEGGIDEIHLVFTEFINSVTQRPKAVRLLPLVVEETTDDEGPMPLYEFEPSAEGVLDALLPRYLESRVWNALLQSAAAESAARRRAMKSASDNADELIKDLVRAANAARQAEITQEIMEIVGGVEALSGGSE